MRTYRWRASFERATPAHDPCFAGHGERLIELIQGRTTGTRPALARDECANLELTTGDLRIGRHALLEGRILIRDQAGHAHGIARHGDTEHQAVLEVLVDVGLEERLVARVQAAR